MATITRWSCLLVISCDAAITVTAGQRQPTVMLAYTAPNTTRSTSSGVGSSSPSFFDSATSVANLWMSAPKPWRSSVIGNVAHGRAATTLLREQKAHVGDARSSLHTVSKQ